MDRFPLPWCIGFRGFIEQHIEEGNQSDRVQQ